MRGVIVGIAVLAGCADLEPLARQSCGNAVVESGEDCDRFVDPTLGPNTACDACRYVCTGASECPAGWGCGADGVCRYASGAFEEPGAPVAAQGYEFVIGDVNGDETADVVGYSAALFWLHFGLGGGRLGDAITYPTLLSYGDPGWGDLDGDATLDGVGGGPQSMGVMVGRDVGFEPVPQAAAIFSAEGGVVTAPLRAEPWPFHDFLLGMGTGGLFVVQLQRLGAPPAAPMLLEYHTVDELGGLAIGDLDLDPAEGQDDVALVFTGESRARVFGTDVDAVGSPFLVPRAELPLPEPAGQGAAWADLDGDGAADLLVRAESGNVLVARGDGLGGFAAAAVDPSFTAEGGSGFPLAVGDLDGDGDDDFVGPGGIYLNAGGAIDQVGWSSIGPWRCAAIGDYNRDGIADVAGGGAASGVELMLGGTLGLYTRAILGTEGVPTAMITGDFDGDRVFDLAIHEARPAGDLVSVLFGDTRGPPADPAPIGRFQRIRSISTGHLTIGTDDLTFDDVNEIMVQSSAGTALSDENELSLFIGAADRRLMAPVDLGTDPAGFLVGRFTPGDADADVLVRLKTTPYSPLLLVGDGTAHFREDDRRQLPPVGVDGALLACALFTSGDLDGDAVDEVIGISCGETESPPQLLIGKFGGSSAAPILAVTATPFAGLSGTPVSLELADVDRDLQPDLVVGFTTDVLVLWNSGGAFDLEASPVVLPDPPGLVGYGAVATINADRDPWLELAVDAGDGVYLADVGADRQLTVGPLPVAGSGRPRAADLSGDGLDDLVVLDDFALHVYVALPHDRAAVIQPFGAL